MNLRNYTIDEYIDKVKSFHGFVAPGVIIGGIMVELAYQNLPKEGLFDAISETSRCLPDAIQLLTPCTVGNNWLRVFNFGRFALTLYDKINGKGARVFIQPAKLDCWPEIKAWFFKLKPKAEQDNELLLKQIKQAGTDILSMQKVNVNPDFLIRQRREKFAICPECLEAYPAADGSICLACKEKVLYR